jgi:hypothetical protein
MGAFYQSMVNSYESYQSRKVKSMSITQAVLAEFVDDLNAFVNKVEPNYSGLVYAQSSSDNGLCSVVKRGKDQPVVEISSTTYCDRLYVRYMFSESVESVPVDSESELRDLLVKMVGKSEKLHVYLANSAKKQKQYDVEHC